MKKLRFLLPAALLPALLLPLRAQTPPSGRDSLLVVFWNVETDGEIECESPWAEENTPTLSFVSPYASGRNYCIGLLGGDRVNYFAGKNEDAYVKAGFPSRPDPQWYPARVEYGDGGRAHVLLPCAEAEAACSWWPRFSISSFDHPESLYLSQLQDRRTSGNSGCL